MPKTQKILVLAFFITILRLVANAQNLLAYHDPEVLLKVKSVIPQEVNSGKSSLTHTTYKITQSTKKINTTLVQQEAVLLLHLTVPVNQVYLETSNAIGQQVLATEYSTLESGFYEIPLLPANHQSQLYLVSLVINHRTYSFQISPAL